MITTMAVINTILDMIMKASIAIAIWTAIFNWAKKEDKKDHERQVKRKEQDHETD